jgi:hypothetical protein
MNTGKENMARCPHCNKILNDDWLRQVGARLMGRRGGVTKRRVTSGRVAAEARWKGKKDRKTIDKPKPKS